MLIGVAIDDMELFDAPKRAAPLAERVRPTRLDEFVGQEHLLDDGKPLRVLIDSDRIPSLIFWGPPGSGKTTLARLIARQSRSAFYQISAVSSGVREVRDVLARAEENRRGLQKRTILFIDEIHRFNKAQQDALLHGVEDGLITLIGATTENPSFEVIPPLLSRCRIYVLHPLSSEHLNRILDHALHSDAELAEQKVEVADYLKELRRGALAAGSELRVISLAGAVMGEEAAAKLGTVAAAGLTVDQVKALGITASSAVATVSAEADIRQEILSALKGGGEEPVVNTDAASGIFGLLFQQSEHGSMMGLVVLSRVVAYVYVRGTAGIDIVGNDLRLIACRPRIPKHSDRCGWHDNASDDRSIAITA